MSDEVSRLRAQRAATLDEARPEAVARQHDRKRWTARERIAALADSESFVEYGSLVQPRDRRLEGPADGLVMGVAQVDARPVCLLAYDFTVYAGTQSPNNHLKIDRMLELARKNRWPVVCWTEGGGARTNELGVGGQVYSFVRLAALSGLVPTIAIVPGPCFAGNANLAGVCDLVIGTRDATMGIAGPPLVAAATGEKLRPEEIGPAELHARAGSMDLLCDDDREAIGAARAYLAFFGERSETVETPNTEALRSLVPESRRRAYDVRKAIRGIADVDSVLELRDRFGRAAVIALARIGGRTVGFVANQPSHLAGAVDSDAADKMARFIGLCDAYDFPLVMLCDTPGFMVGPRSEATALVRHSSRVLIALANATVPVLSVILRKAYGLGYYVMGSGAFEPALHVAWPSAEFGGMGLEGAVEIQHREQLAAAPDEAARAELREQLVEAMRQQMGAFELARDFSIDDVIDPADTRTILASVLDALPAAPPRESRKHPVDAW